MLGGPIAQSSSAATQQQAVLGWQEWCDLQAASVERVLGSCGEAAGELCLLCLAERYHSDGHITANTVILCYILNLKPTRQLKAST
jgi:hypothetical protein